MKRINLESFLCKMELILVLYLPDYHKHVLISKPLLNLHMMNI